MELTIQMVSKQKVEQNKNNALNLLLVVMREDPLICKDQ
jgi:hypothetical protein